MSNLYKCLTVYPPCSPSSFSKSSLFLINYIFSRHSAEVIHKLFINTTRMMVYYCCQLYVITDFICSPLNIVLLTPTPILVLTSKIKFLTFLCFFSPFQPMSFDSLKHTVSELKESFRSLTLGNSHFSYTLLPNYFHHTQFLNIIVNFHHPLRRLLLFYFS